VFIVIIFVTGLTEDTNVPFVIPVPVTVILATTFVVFARTIVVMPVPNAVALIVGCA
jgi:hypothetical protein